MKKIKKISSAFIGSILLIGILLASYLYFSIPRQDIQLLAKGYVSYTLKDKKPIYKIVSKRPSGWVDIDKVSQHAVNAIVVSEDWGFFEHEGYDVEQIKEAVNDTMEKGKRLRGASTISQQVVKNLFFDHQKSYVRKVKELVVTLYLEKHISKRKILEIYLNIIEFGEGLYGIGEASRFYFGKSYAALNAKEGAFLAMLLPSPKRYAQSFRQKKLTPYASKTIDSILRKMVVAKYLDKGELDRELSRKLYFRGTPQKNIIDNVIKEIERPIKKLKKVIKKVIKKASPEKSAKPVQEETNYQVDPDLLIGDDPEFDEEAIPDSDGDELEEEFNAD